MENKNKNEKKKSHKLLKVIISLLSTIIGLVIIYFAYVLIAYHRIGDMPVQVENTESVSKVNDELVMSKNYKLLSWNIGFGAYEDDYSFFMDGGTESWAWSKERLEKNLNNISDKIKSEDPDLCILQEVDFASTRSYRYDERFFMAGALTNHAYTFCQNYDSPFLFYPILQPHGRNRSGLMTFSSVGIKSAERKELPIEKSLMKLVDLDRCYSKNRIAIEGGNELVLYNFHLSAYTSDGKIATEQLIMLLDDMQSEYDKGNYCIAGGDFNKDLLGKDNTYFSTNLDYTWAQEIPAGTFDNYAMNLVAPLDEDDPVPSCRNADSAYHDGQYVVTVDGFIVSDNIEVIASSVIDTGFKYSDHNPVYLEFHLD